MKCNLRYVVLSSCLLFAAHLAGAANSAEADSSKSKYALSDPRNPDCPCHKYQAQADKEYARLLQKSGQGTKLQVNGKGLAKGEKPRRIRSRSWTRDKRRGQAKKVYKTKCFADRLSRCFHF
jgi:hypothetical protein